MGRLDFSLSVARSKVGRRVVLLFITCALVPIAVLAAITEFRVSGQLSDAAWMRLRDQSKTTGMEILERLKHLDFELRAAHSTDHLHGAEDDEAAGHPGDGFLNVSRFVGDPRTELERLIGRLDASVAFPPNAQAHLASGKSLLFLLPARGMSPRIYMIRHLSAEGRDNYVVAEIDRNYLLGLGDRNTLPAGLDHCVVEDRMVLACTSVTLAAIRSRNLKSLAHSSSARAEFHAAGEDLLAGSWTVPLHTWFVSPGWAIVSVQPKADALGPIRDFRKTFGLSVLLSIWIVTLASSVQIRRSLRPLEQLREGTLRVAARDLTTPVVVSSNDEFEELAQSFNTMTRELDRERIMTAAVADLDRAVLSALEAPAIVKIILDRLPPLLDCPCVAVTLIDDVSTGMSRTHVRSHATQRTTVTRAELSAPDLRRLHETDAWTIDVASGVPAFLAPMVDDGIRFLTAFPVHAEGVPTAVVSLARPDGAPLPAETLGEATRMLGPISVALSNARLHEALDKLNLGTLNALARTVDAKCKWTAGHSERVAAISVELGKAYGLRRAEVDMLYRGALLHDIGKIGVPNEIIDKPGELTADEWRLMRAHPRLGATILEPINEYRAIIPMVLQHHEWVDGSGYPDGLSGDGIHRDARLLAVADVFDALRSNRPYRPGLSLRAALDIVRQNAGRQFDPKMARTFLDLVASKPAMFEIHATWDSYEIAI